MSDFINPELKDGPESMAAGYLGNGPGLQPPDPLPIPDLEKVQDLFLDGMATGVAAILGQLLGDQGIEGEDQRPIIDGAINNIMSSLLDNPEGVEKVNDLIRLRLNETKPGDSWVAIFSKEEQ